ncbi:hypothetical protein [Pseudoalteromonas sp. OOF1S-7]|uniref:hypothetical protein n=1 Tax=Pseudoalteromonas sp. OOF1S-7 TaxID=2917757 RepID=UPI001EF5FF1B|nr:hypothetical protein [Pseudoalteromonas sp. OOF1S-7]MCG7537510.1 hypothetical protein [Pseudoalteromonas sp. OOF1S-7]
MSNMYLLLFLAASLNVQATDYQLDIKRKSALFTSQQGEEVVEVTAPTIKKWGFCITNKVIVIHTKKALIHQRSELVSRANGNCTDKGVILNLREQQVSESLLSRIFEVHNSIAIDKNIELMQVTESTTSGDFLFIYRTVQSHVYYEVDLEKATYSTIDLQH